MLYRDQIVERHLMVALVKEQRCFYPSIVLIFSKTSKATNDGFQRGAKVVRPLKPDVL